MSCSSCDTVFGSRSRSSSARNPIVLFAVLPMLIGLCGILVAARPNNPCTQDAPPGEIKDLKCPSDAGAWLNFLLPLVIGPILCLVLGALTTICCTCACIGRCCCGCCGSNKMRPAPVGSYCCPGGQSCDDAYAEDLVNEYDKRCVLIIKVLTAVMFILGIVAMAVSFAGVGQVQAFPTRLAEGAKGLVDWVMEIITKILGAFNSTNPAFATAKGQMDGIKTSMDDMKSQIDKLADSTKPITGALLGLAIPTIVVFLATLLGGIAAVCRIREWLPGFAIFFVIIAAIPTGLLATLTGLVKLPFDVWCQEVDAWKDRQPGLFVDYIKPKFCSATVNFQSLKDKLNSEAGSLSRSTCNDLNSRCDASDSWASVTSGKVFKCTAPVACDSISGLVGELAKLQIKAGTPGADTCAAPCTIDKCATACSDTANLNTKTIVSTIWNGANDANNALKAINDVIDNYLNCDIIMTKLLEAFDICSTIGAGLNNIYAGAAIGVTVNLILPVLMFMGQKRFFKSTGWNHESTSATGTAEMTLLNFGQKDATSIQVTQANEAVDL